MREAARLADARACSRAQLIERLLSRGHAREDCEAAAERLIELGALNDGAFAREVCFYYESRGYGIKRISHELLRRGIGREDSEEALRSLSDPVGAIRAYLNAHLPENPSQKDLKKAFDTLLRRGFIPGDVRSAMKDPED